MKNLKHFYLYFQTNTATIRGTKLCTRVYTQNGEFLLIGKLILFINLLKVVFRINKGKKKLQPKQASCLLHILNHSKKKIEFFVRKSKRK